MKAASSKITVNGRKFTILQNVGLKTNSSGHVSAAKEYFQIKVWIENNLVGAITFHLNMYDFAYSGIVKKSNYRQILDVWFYTGISNFAIEPDGNEWIVKIPFQSYFGKPEYAERFKKLMKDYPEFKNLKLDI